VIRYALFDVDETLYPPEAGVLQAIDRRIERYLVERMGLALPQAVSLRAEYTQRYGTTLGGLLAHHAADAEDYLAYVHDVPIETLLQPNAGLDRALQELPWELMVFTNADRRHAERVLRALGIRSRFRRIFDITGLGRLAAQPAGCQGPPDDDRLGGPQGGPDRRYRLLHRRRHRYRRRRRRHPGARRLTAAREHRPFIVRDRRCEPGQRSPTLEGGTQWPCNGAWWWARGPSRCRALSSERHSSSPSSPT